MIELADRFEYRWSGKLQCEFKGYLTTAQVQEYLVSWRDHAERKGIDPENYNQFWDWFQDEFLDGSEDAWEISFYADLYDAECDENPITQDMVKAFFGGDIIMIHKDQGKLELGDLSAITG